MKVLVVGASGATGKNVVSQLLSKGHELKIVVRSLDRLPEKIRNNKQIEIVEASLLDLSDEELRKLCDTCDAVISCLGHTLSWKGIYGSPRKLVRDAVYRLCQAMESNKPKNKTKFVLMNTTGNRNRDLSEPLSLIERGIIGTIRFLLPSQADNEQAADVLRTKIGQDHPNIEWVVIRPDSLVDAEKSSLYEIHASPIKSAIFGNGKTSRINIAHFMVALVSAEDLWQRWKGQMPVIYDC